APRRASLGPRGCRVLGMGCGDPGAPRLAPPLPRLDADVHHGVPRGPDSSRDRGSLRVRGDERRADRRAHDARALPGVRMTDNTRTRFRLAFTGETIFPHAFPRPGFARANAGLARTQRGPLLLKIVGEPTGSPTPLPVRHRPETGQ